jgi:hypothetical protein
MGMWLHDFFLLAKDANRILSITSIANSASYLSTMLRTDGAPNDVLYNFNPLSIILFSPILNVSGAL